MSDFSRLEDQLLAIEARIGLLDACRPLGLGRERARIQELLSGSGRPNPAELVPRLDFPARSAPEAELVRLEQIALSLARAGRSESARILAERTQELVLDVELVRARGTPGMVPLARRRFVGSGADERQDADLLAAEWLEQAVGVPAEAEGLVDLAAELRHLLSLRRLAIEVRQVDMAARAAISDDALLVQSGARVTPRHAARILAHEVLGHFLPRQAAKRSGPPFRIGPRGADADEEGRALHLEMIGGHVDAERRLELAVRHVLAAQVLDGGHVGEKMASLFAEGVPAELLAALAPRVVRAGGLCREIVYLPGLLRVGPRLADPEVETVFRSGRATLAEVPVLSSLLGSAYGVQLKSATTGV